MDNNSFNNQSVKAGIFPVVLVLDSTDLEALDRTRGAWHGHKEKPLSRLSSFLGEGFPVTLSFYDDDTKWLDMRYYYVAFEDEDAAACALLAAKLSGDCLQAAFRFTKTDRSMFEEGYYRLSDFNRIADYLAALDTTVRDYLFYMKRCRPNEEISLSHAFVEVATLNLQMETALIRKELERFIPDMKVWSRSEESFS